MKSNNSGQVLVVKQIFEIIRNTLDISGVMAILILILNALVTIYIGQINLSYRQSVIFQNNYHSPKPNYHGFKLNN